MTKTLHLTLGQAAKETGWSKATISKALKNGTLSYIEKNSAGYKIDPAELHRVFTKRSTNTEGEQSQTPKKDTVNSGLNTEVDALHQQIESLTSERDRERQQLTSQIDDLKHRLDRESEERRALTTRLLPSPDKQGFLKKLFGKG